MKRARFVKGINNLIIIAAIFFSLILLKYEIFDNVVKGALLNKIGEGSRAFLILGFSFIILLVIVPLFIVIDKLSEKELKIWSIVLLVICALGFVLFLLGMNVLPNTDSFVMFDQAKYFAKNGSDFIEGSAYYEYYGWFSNNHFLTVVFVWIYKVLFALGIENSYYPFFVINAIFLYASNVLIWLIVKKFSGVKAGVKALVLVTLNPVFYLMLFWVYSATISVPFLLGIVYLGLLIYEDNRGKWIAVKGGVIGVLAGISYYIRPTSLIPVIALMLLGILLCIKQWKVIKKLAIVAVPFVLCLIVSCKLVSLQNDRYFSDVYAHAFPPTHWIMMSSHGNGKVVTDDQFYTASFETKEEKVAANIEVIMQNYKERGFLENLKFWYKKMAVTFADGASQITERLVYDAKMGELQKWTTGRYSDIFILYCNAFRVVTFLMIIYSLICAIVRKRVNVLQLLCALTFIGGLIFYCLWEVKSSYSVPFIPLLVILAVPNAKFRNDAIAITEKKFKYISLLSTVISFCCCLVIMGGLFHFVNKDGYTIKEYSLCSTRCWDSYVPFLLQNGDSMTQEIPLKRDVNVIELHAYIPDEYAGLECQYLVELFDEDDNCLEEKKLDASDFNSKKKITKLKFKNMIDINPNKMYSFRITKESGDAVAFFRSSVTLNLDSYENGVLTINGVESNKDLYMKAYSVGKKKYMRMRTFAMMTTVIMLFVFGVWLSMIRTLRRKLSYS